MDELHGVGVDALQILGVVLVIAGLVGGGIKLFGHELPVISSIPRAILTVGLGLALFFLGPTLVERTTRFRVVSVRAQWNQSQGNACNAEQPYTVSIETAGGSGDVKYRLILDDRRFEPKTLTTTGSRTYTEAERIIFKYAPDTLDIESSAITVEVLEPNPKTSEKSTMTLYCKETSKDLKASLQDFLRAHYEAAKTYGRSSSAVTHEFFGYPVTWFNRDFKTEDKFVCYLDRCDEAPRVDAASTCEFEPPIVTRIVSVDEDRIAFEGTVDWIGGQGTDRGQTRVNYEVSRSREGQPYRIRSITQPRKNEVCR